jgi:hypothetical protein
VGQEISCTIQPAYLQITTGGCVVATDLDLVCALFRTQTSLVQLTPVTLSPSCPTGSPAKLHCFQKGWGDTKFKCKHITYHLKTTEVHRNVEMLSYGNDRTSTRNHLYYKTVSRPALWLEISAWIVLKLNHEVTILFTTAKLQHSSSLNLKTVNSIKCVKIKTSLCITVCREHKQKTHRQTSFQPNLCNRCQWWASHSTYLTCEQIVPRTNLLGVWVGSWVDLDTEEAEREISDPAENWTLSVQPEPVTSLTAVSALHSLIKMTNHISKKWLTITRFVTNPLTAGLQYDSYFFFTTDLNSMWWAFL